MNSAAAGSLTSPLLPPLYGELTCLIVDMTLPPAASLVLEEKAKQSFGMHIEVDLCLIGKKGAQFFRSYGGNVVAANDNASEAPEMSDLIGSIKVMLDSFVDGLLDTATNKFLVLGVKALWTTPTANAVDLRFEVRETSASRGIFTPAADSTSRIQLDDGTAFAANGEIWRSLGTGHRLVEPDSNEFIRINYSSGAAAGGTVDVVIYALVEEGVEAE